MRIDADLPTSVSLYPGSKPTGYVEVEHDLEPGILLAIDDGGVNAPAQIRLSAEHAHRLATALLAERGVGG